MSSGVIVAAVAIGIPALAFVLWPLVRRGDSGAGLLPLPPDPREELLEERASVYRALRELQFEHDAGHLSDDDYASLRDRYESRAATILAALDALAPGAEPPAPRPAVTTAGRRWTRRPVTLAVGGIALLVFGIVLGLGAARYTEPDRAADAPMPGSRPLAPTLGAEAGGAAPTAANAPTGPVTPEMLAGMLQAARSSLMAGRYQEAIAAYQAVLKRDARNVDALTHLALIVAIGGHADAALETLDRALAIDPNYAPALLYRGRVLYDVKDYEGAVRVWEKFLAVIPEGEDHDQVAELVREARERAAKR
jgi:tetratricopeptide (TPR) repeat protein